MESQRIEMPWSENTLVEGTVQMICETRYMIASRVAGTVRATRAAGCLLLPETGDRVLVALTGENAWVLSVLERASRTATLALPESTTLRAESLDIEARTLTLSAPVMLFSGKLLAQGFDFVRTAAVKLVEVAVRRHGRYGKLREETSDMRELTAGRLRMESRHGTRIEAENIDIEAQRLLRANATDLVKIG
ncbi:MAG: DUF3540 domain-containing protein [Candidatus Accumulibacter sp.]|jgi:hypothetical protein|nr:DUF3540 domain-containing protein [Accumulibacter sp.]